MLAWVLGALAWPIAALSAPSSAPSEAFAAGSREFQSGEWAAALAHFREARDAGMDGPAVRYNIGVCQYRLGRYADAVASFTFIADRYPEMAPLALYNAGLALYRQQRRGEATTAFERAAATGDAKVAGMASAMLERLRPGRPAATPDARAARVAFTDFSLGYDDNVALLDDASLPAESTDSGFAQFFGQLSSPARGGRGWHGTASAYVIRYPDAGSFDQNVLQLAAAWRWSWHDWRADAGPYYSYSTLDGDGFEQRLGAALTMTRAFGAQTELAARAAVEEVGDLDSRFAFVDGSRRLLEFRLRRRAGAGRYTLKYEFSVDNRAAASVSPTRHQFHAGYRRWIGDRWSIETAASFRSSRYDDLSEPRDEDRIELSLAASRDLPGGDWQVTGQYRLSENDSNVDGFSYDRNRLTLGLNRAFH